MEKGNTWTLNMLEAFLSIYQTLVTIITFFAGFVFATIPVVLFAVEISCVWETHHILPTDLSSHLHNYD